MSQMRREMGRKRFAKESSTMDNLISRIDPEGLLHLSWGIWGLQQPEPIEDALRNFTYPEDAVTSAFGQKFSIYAWELETLLNMRLNSTKPASGPQFRTDHFMVGQLLTQHLRSLENTQTKIYLDKSNVYNELHRIGHRQFSWQRGFANRADFYRYIYLYGRGGCATYFEQKHGVSVEQFTKVGFALFASLAMHPYREQPLDFRALNIDLESGQHVASIMTVPLADTRSHILNTEQRLRASGLPLAYRPSILRSWPIIGCGPDNRRLRSPLPPLIMLRMTAGLYYDLQGASGDIRNEISANFENYCRDYMSAMMPAFIARPEYKYKIPGRKTPLDSPDILVEYNGGLSIIIECKATKLTFPAQFADDPAKDAEDKYNELAKGVFQIWRFIAHSRQGRTQHQVNQATRGLVLTLDSWLTVSRPLQENVLGRAFALADEAGGIDPEDRVPVMFTSIQDLERILSDSTEADFLETLAISGEDRFLGWALPDVRQQGIDRPVLDKGYPFRLEDIVQWWGELPHLLESRDRRNG